MASPWVPTGPVASLAWGRFTLVEGSTFALSDTLGDMHGEQPQGLFVLDTRVISTWQLRVDGLPMEELAVANPLPYAATFVGRTHPTSGHADSSVLVFRERHIGQGMREVVTLRNYGDDPREVYLELAVDADFAHLFEVKERRVRRRGAFRSEGDPGVLRFGHRLNDVDKEVEILLSEDCSVESGLAAWAITVPAHGDWSMCLGVNVTIDGQAVEPRFRCGVPDTEAEPTVRLDTWRAQAPVLETDDARLQGSVAKAIEDLGSLHIYDPEHPESPVIAAGAPWFMTLFGRDSLLTSWMALLVDPTLALGVLDTLARLQGNRVDPQTEEEPGRILHEVRFGDVPTLHLGGGHVYYGTADATPLFVMLLGELQRWGLHDEAVHRLLPHADRALDWIRNDGDRDGDGYVEYQRANPDGLANQGWKDSWDGITFADGTIAEPPIALAEVQAYTYAAFVARSHFAYEAGDHTTGNEWRTRAEALRAAFNRDFWLPDRGWYAVALDAEKRPVDSLTSNMGHCLWTGIVDTDHATEVADQLLGPELFSGWGIRTLATSMGAYNPVSYHNGSVWPHDNAICAAGLMRYGFVDHAHRVIDALLDVAALHDGRLPELFAGISRDELPVPAAYPTSCSPQAWSSASPLLVLRTLLGFDPAVRERRLHLAPEPLGSIHRLRLSNVQVDERRVDVEWSGEGLAVEGLGDITLLRQPPR
jgi:glycogen debranching enzyme